ncbi:MAG: HD domain-containing protein [Clostridiales bacterium]|nr:HD domain-containing protein [Clostridiales bacterium]
MSVQTLMDLLSATDWCINQPLVDALHRWSGYPLFQKAAEELDDTVLFASPIHGPGHIYRTLCHGAFCAMEEPLTPEDTQLLLLACAYHDVGRENDTLDELHGWRAAQRLPAITGLTGEDLKLVQAAVDAHSRSDDALTPTVEGYHLADTQRGLALAELLKDADGLDRVRIWDLDPAYLRREASRQRAAFAKELYLRYQRTTGGALVPAFVQEWKHLDAQGEPLPPSAT